jgi:hypothetical protein
LMTPSVMQELCLSRGINLSFVPLPPELHGLNCSFQNKNEIVISEHETVPFAHVHILFHEFREMLEHMFVQLGHPTLTQKESLEVKAEEFAMTARMETLTRELPSYIELISSIEKNWHRYFGYGFLIVFSVAYMFGCVLLPQFEDMMAEARRQRYVRNVTPDPLFRKPEFPTFKHTHEYYEKRQIFRRRALSYLPVICANTDARTARPGSSFVRLS